MVVGLLLVYGIGGVVCVFLCRPFIYGRLCGCRDNLSSGTYG